MEVVTLIIALLALVLAVAAFARTGGIRELRSQLDSVASKTETARERAADALNRLEHLIRGKEKPEGGTAGGPGDAQGP